MKVNVFGVPSQAFANGVTVIVATIIALVVFTGVKEAIFPVPVAARPIVGSLFVQVKVLPVTGPVKLTAVVAAPWHLVWLFIVVTVGVGLTLMVKVLLLPLQPFA